MNQEYSTTSNTKGQHLTSSDRKVIKKLLNSHTPVQQIAAFLGYHRSSIYREIKRNQVVRARGKSTTYDPNEGQIRADRNKSRRNYALKCSRCQEFIEFVSKHFHEDNWSFDVCYARALHSGGFSRDEVVSVKTLYNYVNRDYNILHIRNLDLPVRPKRVHKRRNRLKKVSRIGTSIEQRPDNIELRQEFGHWEIDTVLGIQKGNGAAILTLVERSTRFYIAVKMPDKSAQSVNSALGKTFRQYGRRNFLTITADNGSEFSKLPALENRTTKIFFAHPYSAYERGTNERHNGLLRRWIPKGKDISKISQALISKYQDRMNNMPRKILNYFTPKELFERFAATKPSCHRELFQKFS